MSGDVHVRFSEGAGVQFPRATRLVMGFQYEEEAEQVLRALHTRLARCGLTLSERKTRLVLFSRFAKDRVRRSR